MSASLSDLLQQVIDPRIPAPSRAPDPPVPSEPLSALLGRIIRPDWPSRPAAPAPEIELPPLP